MTITERISNCNGCGACAVVCRQHCIRMEKNEQGQWRPMVDEGGCFKCNNCTLYCPLFNPVELPEFSRYYEYNEDYYNRDMPSVYRETMRNSKNGAFAEFAGMLCQIAGLKSLCGDQLRPNLKIYPLHCDPDDPKRPECESCPFIAR